MPRKPAVQLVRNACKQQCRSTHPSLPPALPVTSCLITDCLLRRSLECRLLLQTQSGDTARGAIPDHEITIGKTALPVVPLKWRRCIILVAKFLAVDQRPPLRLIGEIVIQRMDTTKVKTSSTLSETRCWLGRFGHIWGLVPKALGLKKAGRCAAIAQPSNIHSCICVVITASVWPLCWDPSASSNSDKSGPNASSRPMGLLCFTTNSGAARPELWSCGPQAAVS